LAAKTASEMAYTVWGGALNSAQTDLLQLEYSRKIFYVNK